MTNPFRSEQAAFRLLLVTIGAFALIALASALNPWLGLVVFVVEAGAATGYYLWQRPPKPPPAHVEPLLDDTRRVLVVANETVGGVELLDLVRDRAAAPGAVVLVVCPALNSRVKTWTSDEDAARAEAQARLDASLARLAAAGIVARGEIGDGDPVQAVEDALRTFPADEILLSTHPPGRSNWLERGVIAAVGDRFDVPVTHVVVDLESRAE